MSEKTRRDNRIFMWMMTALTAVLFLRYYEGQAVKINTTMLAFSYKYGFVSRGLVGSIFQTVCRLPSSGLDSYRSAVTFFTISAVIYEAVLLLCLGVCLKHCNREAAKWERLLILEVLFFAVPMFASQYNLGRLDMYCVLLTCFAVMLLVCRRAEWLVIPLSALACCVHQGYVFMFFNVVLVLLFWRAMQETGRDRRRYLVILILSLIVVAALFLWFELFSHHYPEGVYAQITKEAARLGPRGKIHKDVIDHEILGIDLSTREMKWKYQDWVQAPWFVLLVLPYLILLIRFFRILIRSASGNAQKFSCIALAAGAATMLPELLLKVDYGRWAFAIIFYYGITLTAVLAMGEETVLFAMRRATAGVRRDRALCVILLAYPLVLQPLLDVNICYITWNIATFLNANLLHLW